MIDVFGCVACVDLMSRHLAAVARSRPEVGSSYRITSGSKASVRAIASRCFCPPLEIGGPHAARHAQLVEQVLGLRAAIPLRPAAGPMSLSKSHVLRREKAHRTRRSSETPRRRGGRAWLWPQTFPLRRCARSRPPAPRSRRIEQARQHTQQQALADAAGTDDQRDLRPARSGPRACPSKIRSPARKVRPSICDGRSGGWKFDGRSWLDFVAWLCSRCRRCMRGRHVARGKLHLHHAALHVPARRLLGDKSVSSSQRRSLCRI